MNRASQADEDFARQMAWLDRELALRVEEARAGDPGNRALAVGLLIGLVAGMTRGGSAPS
ncbi:hypothetical protein D3C87_2017290 [compost metagenome]|jgi:hypothetical protein|uniref:hypothetical protein n=1 Tax=unclassified Brevundimonas TaxID=2622653 RepID=UPI000CFAEF7E|nr:MULTISPECIES: hypothetical protein [unclassified Brevundimonas]PRA35790.1 hypothetical protein CQ024_01705 [Brevundimonas sp. MYb27]PQZ83113.1 hypothetical protein CQ026_06360 [Brevundimonas sp. MYb31]PRB16326.1 hypothetical protein CQ039_06340 [Brevundimonas sp. MYb52]PRB34925.1 hypothetical protein CQ035_09420 [Brevundimonas sp. MYb46]PRB55567.1 hypothetical protein CQ028_02930 [Brevundimonas sp. MYb33]